jgi:pyruvate,water dikinase
VPGSLVIADKQYIEPAVVKRFSPFYHEEERSCMRPLVLDFQEVDRTQLALVGGKGMRLGELAKIPGLRVPEGFCVTTAAYQFAIEHNDTYRALLDQLTALHADDLDQISEISRHIRQIVMEAEIPPEVEKAVAHRLSRFGEKHAFAVRSSATAEDMLQASFAGQLDSFLNIIGLEAILQHIRKCWASLFTDRAVIYRMRNGFDHRQVDMSVIVQRMVFPQASGIMFTADPVTSNRKLLSIDASFGLGEALVSGLVSADCYQVRDEEIVEKRIADKTLAVYERKEGGTETKQIDPERQRHPTLTDQQILQLARIGRQIEAYFGQPQDIEWCMADDAFYVVQSRPITTLYPIPEADDQNIRVYVSVGHQQMMTDAMKPLGLSFYLLTTNAPMRIAGGRLFVDVTQMLASPGGRETLFRTLGQSDPLIKDALMTVAERAEFNPPPSPQDPKQQRPGPTSAGSPARIEDDPAIVSDLIQRSQASLETLKQNIRTKSGLELLDFIVEDIQQLKKMLFDPQSIGVIMAAMNAASWINDNMEQWLGIKNAADALSQSVPHNVTSEMGLALLDVADAIRPYPEVIAYLQQVHDDRFLDELVKLEGGQEASNAIRRRNKWSSASGTSAGTGNIRNTSW